MNTWIGFVMGNFTLTFFVIASICTAISYLRRPAGDPHRFSEPAIAYFCLVAIGLCFFYNFVFHVFFGDMAAGFIGWAQSPFQAEVGWASLGMAMVAIIAFWRGHDMRFAAVLGPAMFMWGAAYGHIVQEIEAHNYAPGNAGIMLYSDILLPIVGFALLWLRYWRDGSTAGSEDRRTVH